MRGSLGVSQSQQQLALALAVQVEAGQAGQAEAGQAGRVEAGRAGRVVSEPGPTGLLPGQAIAVVVSGAVATVLPIVHQAGHLGNLQAARLGSHLAPVLGSHLLHQESPTGSWPGRKSTWGHD